MTSVFITTEGSYSDYRITGVYETLDKAREHLAEDGSIEEWPLDGGASDRLSAYEVELRPYSKELDARKRDHVMHPNSEVFKNLERFTTWCWAESANHAIKIARERMARFREAERAPEYWEWIDL